MRNTEFWAKNYKSYNLLKDVCPSNMLTRLWNVLTRITTRMFGYNGEHYYSKAITPTFEKRGHPTVYPYIEEFDNLMMKTILETPIDKLCEYKSLGDKQIEVIELIREKNGYPAGDYLKDKVRYRHLRIQLSYEEENKIKESLKKTGLSLPEFIRILLIDNVLSN